MRNEGRAAGTDVASRAQSDDVRIFPTRAALSDGAADWLCALAEARSGRFAVCLSGGSTPRPLYERLATPTFAARFPWRRVHWFWGDERFVSRTDPQSNYRMVYEALFSAAPVPEDNIHAIPTGASTPEEAAIAYEATLKEFYGSDTLDAERPLFDVTLLGIGEDGHTASLFPDRPELRERRRWTAAVVGARAEPRITLTFPALDSSAHIAFLATGEGKREAVRRALSGDRALPAALVTPVGLRHWFLDRAASPEGEA